MAIFCSDPPRLVKFKYIANIPLWEIEKPYAIDQVENVCDGMISNLQYEEHESESLHDLRGSEDQLNIFENSFAYIKHPTDLINLPEEEMMTPYAEEINSLIKRMFNTDRVITYDLRFRENRIYMKEETLSKSRTIPSPPVSVVHSDHTKEGGWDRIARTLTNEELVEYRSGRWRARIVNVWRSLNPIVEDSPLAFLDPSSVSEEDLVEVDRVSPISIGRIYNLKYNPKHRWYWLSNQTWEEAAVFVCFDSSPLEDRFNYCPHSAFIDPDSRPGAPMRRSVETRTLVFTPL